jgi:catechol 2,3-dioxygenase-like lactoylglutathione lyase family enzyme
MVSELGLAPIGQVGLVVRDLEGAMEGFWRTFGIGPWKVYTNSAPPLRCSYRGRPVSYRMRVALAQSGPLVIELLQYLDGECLHRDFMETGRDGLEHLGIYVPQLDRAVAHLQSRGLELLQIAHGIGVHGDGGYAFLDTERTLGAILELIQAPSERFPPEKIYPSPSKD